MNHAFETSPPDTGHRPPAAPVPAGPVRAEPRSGRQGPDADHATGSTPRLAAHSAGDPGRPGRWATTLTFVAALAVIGWQVGRPSPSLDEAATLVATRRSPGDLGLLVQNVDLVHALYYFACHLVLRATAPVLPDPDGQLLALRLLSVAATAAAAAGLVAVGRRLGTMPVGVVAAAILLASPLANLWGQSARSAAPVALMAVLATALLLAAAGSGSRRAWVRYGAAVAVLGMLNVLALLLVTGHLAFLVLRRQRARQGQRGPQGRRGTLGGWLVAVVGAGLLVSPIALTAFGQRGQVAWLEPADVQGLAAFYIHGAGSRVTLAVLGLGAVVTLAGHRGLPAGSAGDAFVLGASWAVVPTCLLWGVSTSLPMWTEHYALFALPGLALLGAAEIALLGGVLRGRSRTRTAGRDRLAVVTGVALVAGIATLALPAQAQVRDPRSGHGEDVRGAARWMGRQARPGDAVLYVPMTLRDIGTAYPESVAQMDDVALAVGPVESRTLSGVEQDTDSVSAAMRPHRRVWLVTGDFGDYTTALELDRRKLALLGAGYRATQQADVGILKVVCYEARPDEGGR